MRKMLELCIGVETYRSQFGSAMDNFIEACKDQAGFIKTLGLLDREATFEDAKLGSG